MAYKKVTIIGGLYKGLTGIDLNTHTIPEKNDIHLDDDSCRKSPCGLRVVYVDPENLKLED